MLGAAARPLAHVTRVRRATRRPACHDARPHAFTTLARAHPPPQLSLEGARQEASSLASDNAELRAKLDESRAQLQSNEQMIRWLNQQVTDAQLQASGWGEGGVGLGQTRRRVGAWGTPVSG